MKHPLREDFDTFVTEAGVSVKFNQNLEMADNQS
jgi:hypothetical protein